jgi:hypothetical protein
MPRAVEAKAPDTPHNSIHAAFYNLLSTRAAEIVKVARGTYQLAKFVDADSLRLGRGRRCAEVADRGLGRLDWAVCVEESPGADEAE